jgi:hypothetical protein
MGDGGPEDRPESVPSDEVEAALGPLDLHAHQVEELTEDGGEYLWIERLRQGWDTFDTRREDCHFLTFSLGKAVAGLG